MSLAKRAAPFEPNDTAPAPETGGLKQSTCLQCGLSIHWIAGNEWRHDDALIQHPPRHWPLRKEYDELLAELRRLRSAESVPTVAATNAQLVSENEMLRDNLQRAEAKRDEYWRAIAEKIEKQAEGAWHYSVLDKQLALCQCERDNAIRLASEWSHKLSEVLNRTETAESAHSAALARVGVLEEALIMAKLHLSLPYPEEEPEERMRVVSMIRTALAHEAQRPEEGTG